MKSAVQQWIERMNYDMGTAIAMYKGRRYLYAAFMCQQSVEKGLKAMLAKHGKEVPLTHNLRKLANLAGVENDLGEKWINFLEHLTPFAIKARYGSYKKRLSEICDSKTAGKFIRDTKEFIKWLSART